MVPKRPKLIISAKRLNFIQEISAIIDYTVLLGLYFGQDEILPFVLLAVDILSFMLISIH